MAATTSDPLPDLDDAALDAAVAHYREHGWARLGRVGDAATMAALRARVDAIMLGEVRYPGLFFQHDSETGRYEDLAYGEGWQGPSLRYRKIEKLELDPLFRAWLSQDLFRRVAERVYAEASRFTLYRAFLMHKHEGGGSPLPWHQDGGDFWGLDRDPVLQIWTAIDDAPREGACVEVVDRSHVSGLATRLGGVVPPNHLEAAGIPAEEGAGGDHHPRTVALPARAGDVLLLHNHVWHRSGRTQVGHARRAFSACYMDGATQCRRKKRAPRSFFEVWRRA